jgi:hypothetical protein
LDEFRKKPAETVPVAAPRQRSTHEKEQHESTTSLGGELLARPGSPIKLNCDGAALGARFLLHGIFEKLVYVNIRS